MILSGGGGGGGGKLVLILFDFPLRSPAPHSHNPACLTRHDPPTTFSDHWTTSASVLTVSHLPGLHPVAPPIHPSAVYSSTPHFYTYFFPLSEQESRTPPKIKNKGGGHFWLAYLCALHRYNRDRNGLVAVTCSVSQCKVPKPQNQVAFS